jgi:hypothetical protein
MSDGADGAGKFPDAHLLRREGQSLHIALVLRVPDDELAAEGDGLGMNAVCAADHGGVLELESALLQDFAQAVQSCEQQGGGFPHQQRLRSVDHVIRGEAVVQITALAPHVLRHVGGEGDHVVLHLAFDFENARDFELALAPDGARGALRD